MSILCSCSKDRSLTVNGSAALAKGRLRSLRRAVDLFGFHLASVDLRQNSNVHERTVAELLAFADPSVDYKALPEDERIGILLGELESNRPLASPYADYPEETKSELAILRTAADCRARLGADAVVNCVISKTDGVSDILESARHPLGVQLVAVLPDAAGLDRIRRRARPGRRQDRPVARRTSAPYRTWTALADALEKIVTFNFRTPASP